MTTEVKKTRGEMTATELAKEAFTPRERVGIAMGRLQKMVWGDSSTDWKPMIDDGPMSEEMRKEMEGICEILQNAMKMEATKRDMTAQDLTAHVEAEMAKATTEMEAGNRSLAQKRMAHLQRELTKAASVFDAGSATAPVQLFSESLTTPGEAVSALAKQVEQVAAKAAEPPPAATPEATPAPETPAAPAATPEATPAATPEATPADEPVVTTKADDDEWPDDFASPAEIKKAMDWKPRVASDDVTL